MFNKSERMNCGRKIVLSKLPHVKDLRIFFYEHLRTWIIKNEYSCQVQVWIVKCSFFYLLFLSGAVNFSILVGLDSYFIVCLVSVFHMSQSLQFSYSCDLLRCTLVQLSFCCQYCTVVMSWSSLCLWGLRTDVTEKGNSELFCHRGDNFLQKVVCATLKQMFP